MTAPTTFRTAAFAAGLCVLYVVPALARDSAKPEHPTNERESMPDDDRSIADPVDHGPPTPDTPTLFYDPGPSDPVFRPDDLPPTRPSTLEDLDPRRQNVPEPAGVGVLVAVGVVLTRRLRR